MANTYTALYYHVIFSTKHRHRWLTPDIEERVWSYLGGIARENKMTAMQVGGIEDHIHILLGAPPTIAPSKAVQLPKGGSSKWIHETFANMRAFTWQDGYGAFTVSKAAVPDVIKYIQNQREHHRTMTFQEEYLMFLKRHGVEYDERYLWD
jgi:REP element-mobilizing transposase RayT